MTFDERGHACPQPVINVKKALAEISDRTEVEVLVDNPTAVENFKKFAAQMGWQFEQRPSDAPQTYVIRLIAEPNCDCEAIDFAPMTGRTVILINSNLVGEGDSALGKVLMKSFLYALTEAERKPDELIFMNSGAYLTSEGSESLEDLKTLESGGVTITTCGTCLNFYNLQDSLKVGSVSNMYSIVESLTSAGKVIRL